MLRDGPGSATHRDAALRRARELSDTVTPPSATMIWPVMKLKANEDEEGGDGPDFFRRADATQRRHLSAALGFLSSTGRGQNWMGPCARGPRARSSGPHSAARLRGEREMSRLGDSVTPRCSRFRLFPAIEDTITIAAAALRHARGSSGCRATDCF